MDLLSLPVEILKEIATFLEPFPTSRLALSLVSSSARLHLKPTSIDILNGLYISAKYGLLDEFKWSLALAYENGITIPSTTLLACAAAAFIGSFSELYEFIESANTIRSENSQLFWKKIGAIATPERFEAAMMGRESLTIGRVGFLVYGTALSGNLNFLKWLNESQTSLAIQMNSRKWVSDVFHRPIFRAEIYDSTASDSDLLAYLLYIESNMSGFMSSLDIFNLFGTGALNAIKYIMAMKGVTSLEGTEKSLALAAALKKGHLDCVVFLAVENFDRSILNYGFQSGNVDMMEKLIARFGSDWMEDADEALRSAIRSESVPMLRFILKTYKLSLSEDLFFKCISGSKLYVTIWKYLKRIGCPMNLHDLSIRVLTEKDADLFKQFMKLENLPSFTLEEARPYFENRNSEFSAAVRSFLGLPEKEGRDDDF